MERRFPAWRAYLLAGGAALALYLGLPAARAVLCAGLGLAATVLLAWRARRTPRSERGPWLLFAAALGCLTAGDLVRIYLDATASITFPSVADVSYVSAYPLLALGCARLAARARRRGDRTALLDAGVVAGALAIPTWVWLVAPPASASATWLAATMAAAYPLLGLLILALLARLALDGAPAARSPAVVLGGLALCARLVSDIAHSALVLTSGHPRGSPLDAGWLVSYVLWGCAALRPQPAAASEPRPGRALDPRVRTVLLGAATMVGPAHQIGLALAGETRWRLEIAAVTALVCALVVARLGGLLAEVKLRMEQAEEQRAQLARASADKRSLEERLVEHSLRDALTGLATKALLVDRIEGALARAERSGLRHSVLYVDLDDFKAINQRLGHEAGDLILAEVAARLKNALRAESTAARLGGDGFAVLLEGVSEDGARRVAERVHRAVSGRFAAGGRRVEIRATIGVALSGPGARATDLIQRAALAASAAKEDGSSGWLVFDEAQHSGALQRVALARDLEEALERGELTLHYQPIVDLVSGRITAVEPLLRWQHPRRGLLAAGEFIDAAASDPGLMAALDETMGERAIAQVASWRRSLPAARALSLSLNITPGLAGRPGFVERVAAVLAEHDLPAHALVLEITERELVAECSRASSALDRLAAIGVAIAIDDFGTGYSSLGYLKRLPVAVLKIDRAFVHPVPGSPEDDALVAAIVEIGHSKRLEVVAEGIERPEQISALRAMGCRYGQGFGLVRPVAPQDLATLLGDGALIPLPDDLAQEREQLVRRRDRRSKLARPSLQVPIVGDEQDRVGR